MTTKLQEAAEKLQVAMKAHEVAARELGKARLTETDALNTLNEVQREFDAAVAELRNEAPRDSDWARSRVQKLPSPA